MKRLAVLGAAAAVVFGFTPAGARAGGGGGCGVVTAVGGALYIDDRGNGDPFGMWFYAETNGVPGLQAGGPAIHGLWSDVSCHQSSTPDQLIY